MSFWFVKCSTSMKSWINFCDKLYEARLFGYKVVRQKMVVHRRWEEGSRENTQIFTRCFKLVWNILGFDVPFVNWLNLILGNDLILFRVFNYEIHCQVLYHKHIPQMVEIIWWFTQSVLFDSLMWLGFYLQKERKL